MKIKTILIVSVLALGFSTGSQAGESQSSKSNAETENNTKAASANYSINTESSVVNWKGSMAGVYAHTGTLKLSKGSMVLKNGKISKGNFTVDMNSMKTTDSDDNYKNAPRERLVGHLKSDDFFATEKFPTASFKITKHSENELSGELTVRGITNKETVTNVKISESDGAFKATGNLVFDRQKYKVTYKNKMGDMVLSDDIELTISISGKSE
ncbi:MAG: YceI family protein [Bacteroidales bacterium]|nr:YceI family protein [Bacteroidales bacterium]